MTSSLEDFKKWQANSPSREVTIKIVTNWKGQQDVSVFVWDGTLLCSQHVSSVDEIDLLGDKEKREREELDRLQKKYGQSGA